ncbi:MAG: hypothetical protein LUQ07_06890 [Methanospirillum sp.]|nr:hypothetical protein [Methanospirillum sp.]
MVFWNRRGTGKDTPSVSPTEETSPPLPSFPDPPVKKLRIPLNQTTRDVRYIRNTIVFPCPLCGEINTVELDDLDPVVGGESMCLCCQVMFHVPGGYRTRTEVPQLKIYAGLPVAIRKFPLFYWNHPVISDLYNQGITGIIIQYGLWGFCQKCHHQFSPAVLINLPQKTEELVDYRSLSSDEMNEMKSLRRGECPYCSHRILLVIVSDIPHYVISASDNISHRWEED